MTMKTYFKLGLPLPVLLIALAGMAILLPGCSSCKPGQPGKPRPYNIQVNLDPSLKGKCEVVDLVGVNPASVARWEQYSMSSYWKEGDTLRRDSKPDRVTLSFAAGQPLTQTLNVNNAQWAAWKAKGVNYILVLAELPGRHDDKPANADDRRISLPLDECHWAKGTNTLNVLVQQSGIQLLTPIR